MAASRCTRKMGRASICGLSLLLAFRCLGQTAAQNTDSWATLDIHLGEHEAGFWGRYVVAGQPSRRSGWLVPKDGEDTLRISGMSAGNSARFKGIVYAPGCALQTIDIPLNSLQLYEYSFPCEPLPLIDLAGAVLQFNRPYSQPVQIDAKYVAGWAAAFLGIDDGITVAIPLGNVTTLDQSHRFRLPIPDLSKDKLAGSADHPGEVRIWVHDPDGGRMIGQLRVAAGNSNLQPTRFGGIPIQSLTSGQMQLDFCTADSRRVHDRFGFAMRDDSDNKCGH